MSVLELKPIKTLKYYINARVQAVEVKTIVREDGARL